MLLPNELAYMIFTGFQGVLLLFGVPYPAPCPQQLLILVSRVMQSSSWLIIES
jgi:hypothetical protein